MPAHASPLVFGDIPALAAAGDAAASFPADGEDAILQAQLSEDMDDGLNPDGGGSTMPPCSGGGLLEVPRAVVAYAALNPAGAAGGVPVGVAQVAAEKAALKRQLRQLDADFEVTLFATNMHTSLHSAQGVSNRMLPKPLTISTTCMLNPECA